MLSSRSGRVLVPGGIGEEFTCMVERGRVSGYDIYSSAIHASWTYL